MLLTGDIDAAAERALLAGGRELRADWLQIPHHGSRSSSSATFLEAVSPSAAVLSRGSNNPFGHPHPQVMASYQARGVRVYDNVATGALRIRLGAREAPYGWRERRVFWREK